MSWSKLDYLEIEKLITFGENIYNISKKLGVSVRRIKNYIYNDSNLSQLYLDQNDKKNQITDEEKFYISLGYHVREISQKTGASCNNLTYRLTFKGNKSFYEAFKSKRVERKLALKNGFGLKLEKEEKELLSFEENKSLLLNGYSIEEVSEMVGISIEKFQSYFSYLEDSSFYRDLESKRVERLKKQKRIKKRIFYSNLIKNGNLTPKKLSEKLGLHTVYIRKILADLGLNKRIIAYRTAYNNREQNRLNGLKNSRNKFFSILVNRSLNLSNQYEKKAIEYYLNGKKKSNQNFSFHVLISFFREYFEGNYNTIESLSQATKVGHHSINRILRKVNLEPFNNRPGRRLDKELELIKRGISETSFTISDLVYFLPNESEQNLTLMQGRLQNYKSKINELDSLIPYSSYKFSSFIFEAQDEGFNSSETLELFGGKGRNIDEINKIKENRDKLEGLIISELQFLFEPFDIEIRNPYLTTDQRKWYIQNYTMKK